MHALSLEKISPLRNDHMFQEPKTKVL